MAERLLLGLGRHMIPIPRVVWQRLIKTETRRIRARLGFMSANHHRVRDFVVTELAGAGKPLPPASIAEGLDLPVSQVESILVELERRLTFLARDSRGAVSWAYPVTVEATPHHARFSTGEEAYSP